MWRLQDRVVLITGSAAPIGAEVAARLLAEGACLILADIHQQAGEAVAGDLDRERAAFVTLDVRDPAAWASAVVAAERRFSPVTVLGNCAGATSIGSLESISQAELADVTAVNTFGFLYGMQT